MPSKSDSERRRVSPEDDARSQPKIFTPEYYARMRSLEAGSWWNAGMRDITLRLLRSVSLPAEGKLLDAGCGSGQTMRWLGEVLPSWSRVGIDLAGDAVRAAAGLDETVVQASVTSVPFADASFDLVVCFDVVQHLPIPGGDAAALKELRRTLKARGHLLIRTNSQSFPRIPDDPASMYRRYDPGVLSAALQVAGFDVLRLSRANSLLGLAEIPRELRARRSSGGSYYGLLTKLGSGGPLHVAKRKLLDAEGRLIAAGWRLPFGRALFALCRASA